MEGRREEETHARRRINEFTAVQSRDCDESTATITGFRVVECCASRCPCTTCSNRRHESRPPRSRPVSNNQLSTHARGGRYLQEQLHDQLDRLRDTRVSRQSSQHVLLREQRLQFVPVHTVRQHHTTTQLPCKVQTSTRDERRRKETSRICWARIRPA